MLSLEDARSLPPPVTLPPGRVLLERQKHPEWVTLLEHGRVVLGLREGGLMRHQLGQVEGPFWLEVASAVLEQPEVVDAMSDTPVEVRRVPVAEFRAALSRLPEAARKLVQDMAWSQRQQTELAVSRLAMDAEARCARWLLDHAGPVDQAQQGVMSVLLNQRKRMIAAELGIAPETFSRVLRHLRERSLISGSGRNLTVLDPLGLRTLAGVQA